MKKIVYGLVLLLLAGGCASVSKQQRSVVNDFAAKTENFALYPEKIMGELADIREIRGIYYADSFTDPALHLSELNNIAGERLKDDKLTGKTRIAFKILDEYAGALVQLSSDTPIKNAGDSSLKFGVELETLIGMYNKADGAKPLPSGIGTMLAQTMDVGTRYYLANRQYKELKKFVNQADTLVAVVCDEMAAFLSSKGLDQLVQAEESGVDESFRFYFTKRTPAIESEKEYVALMKRVEGVKQMQKQTIEAAINLRKAHWKLAAELNRELTFEEITVELNNFYKDVELLNKTAHAIGK
jgi:hypothetical protein